MPKGGMISCRLEGIASAHERRILANKAFDNSIPDDVKFVGDAAEWWKDTPATIHELSFTDIWGSTTPP